MKTAYRIREMTNSSDDIAACQELTLGHAPLSAIMSQRPGIMCDAEPGEFGNCIVWLVAVAPISGRIRGHLVMRHRVYDYASATRVTEIMEVAGSPRAVLELLAQAETRAGIMDGVITGTCSVANERMVAAMRRRGYAVDRVGGSKVIR